MFIKKISNFILTYIKIAKKDHFYFDDTKSIKYQC